MSKKKPKNITPPAAKQAPVTPVRKQPVRKSSHGPSNVVSELPFSKDNFIHMLIGVAVVLIGYFFMWGEEFKDASEFSMSLYVAPFFTIAGYVYILYAIMRGSKKKKSEE